jgi:hypothetical protein
MRSQTRLECDKSKKFLSQYNIREMAVNRTEVSTILQYKKINSMIQCGATVLATCKIGNAAIHPHYYGIRCFA